MYLLEKSSFMSGFSMVSKLNLALKSRKLHRIFHSDGMCSIQNGFFGLLIEQIQLDGISGIDIGIAVKILSF